MSEALANLAGTSMLSFTGFYVINKITNQKIKLNIKRIILLLIISIISVSLLKIKTTSIYSIVVILINIIIYKYVFDISIEESIILNGIFTANTCVCDVIVAQIFCLFTTVNIMRTSPIMILGANFSVCISIILLTQIKPLIYQYQKFYKNTSQKSAKLLNIVFIILLVIGFCLIAYNLIKLNVLGTDYVINTLVTIIFMVITIIYIQSRNSLNQLVYKYDSLFSYIQNFEEWIEKEQFNRHEYKNQLAVLRYLTKEKKVKDKIDEILQDNINLEGDVVNKLKYLPKGGIKGLMYYKVIIAQKNNIKLTVDISLKDNSKLKKLTEKQIRTVCQLIGVYFDNAIEAASKTRKKQVTIEIYELKNKVKIVFSNTFRKTKIFDNRNERGVSSKGKGRGNGLYFAKKILSKNNWLTEKQEIIDNYYVQELTIDIEKNIKNK